MLLCLAVYLPGLWSIPPVDRDESRFAQASRTMLESRDFIVPRLGNTPRLNKPPLIYWLQAGSAAILGDAPGPDGLGEWGNGNIWVFRVPSVLCAIGTVLLTWRLGLRMFDPRAAALAAALLAVCPMVAWDAHQARADQLLLFTTTGAMFALYACWKRPALTSLERNKESSPVPKQPLTALGAVRTQLLPAIALWLFIGLGILAKGPITPMIAALTAISLSLATRNWRWILGLRPFLGLIILAAMVAPWVIAIGQRVGWHTYLTTVMDETLGRSIEGKEHHWGPPGYHTVLLAVLFWPGSLVTAAAVVWAWKRARGAAVGRLGPTTRPRWKFSNNHEAFLLAWALPSWIVFELIATKLPHYTMPMYPAIALLSARAAFSRIVIATLGRIVWQVIGILLMAAGPTLLFALCSDRTGALIAFVPSALVAWAALGAARASLRRKQIPGALARSIVPYVIAASAMFLVILPIAPVWLSREVVGDGLVGGLAEIHRREPGRPFATVDYYEDSLLFLTRGRLQRIQPSEIDAWLDQHPRGVVLVTQERLKSRSDLQHVQSILRFSDIGGYDYSTGKWRYLAFAERDTSPSGGGGGH
jgi:4-amino-4-deoxy-L-arabinose transferase-like glycosyltransferase